MSEQPLTFGTIPDYLARESLPINVETFTRSSPGDSEHGYRFRFPNGALMEVIPDPRTAPTYDGEAFTLSPWDRWVKRAALATVRITHLGGEVVTWSGRDRLTEQPPDSVLSLIRMVAREA